MKANQFDKPATQETLGYVCKATVARHNKEGVLYRHGFNTGFQDLVFDSHKTAYQWAENNKLQYTGPHKVI